MQPEDQKHVANPCFFDRLAYHDFNPMSASGRAQTLSLAKWFCVPYRLKQGRKNYKFFSLLLKRTSPKFLVCMLLMSIDYE